MKPALITASGGLWLALSLASLAIAEVTIRFSGEQHSQIEVAGLPAASLVEPSKKPVDQATWGRVLAVRVASAAASAPAMIGEYQVVGDRLVFKPRFPFKPGLAYRATFDPSGLPGPLPISLAPTEAILSIPAPPPSPPPTVAAVYPSSDILPENLLKFYLHFSAPMQHGSSYKHIRLLDSNGNAVELPFLELAEELWDVSGTRLTLLLDPGRIKRELVPNKEVGPPLRSGERYVLKIDARWKDARGTPLASGFRKAFRVADRDDAQPDPERWHVSAPTAGTRDPLVVTLDEPLDQAMLQHAIRVVDSKGQVLVGEIRISDHETRWGFSPADPWAPGSFELQVDPTLEDLAGNSPGRPFEVNTATPPTTSAESHLQLPFEIRP